MSTMIDEYKEMTRILSKLKQPTIVGNELCLIVACKSKATKDRVVSFLNEAKKDYRIVFSVRGNQIFIYDDEDAYDKDEEYDSYLGILGDEREFINGDLINSITEVIGSEIIRVEDSLHELEIHWDREEPVFSRDSVWISGDGVECLLPLTVKIVERFTPNCFSYFVGENFLIITLPEEASNNTIMEILKIFVKEAIKD